MPNFQGRCDKLRKFIYKILSFQHLLEWKKSVFAAVGQRQKLVASDTRALLEHSPTLSNLFDSIILESEELTITNNIVLLINILPWEPLTGQDINISQILKLHV